MEVVGEGESTWAPKANPRAMEVVEYVVTWAPKANPRAMEEVE